MPKLCIRLADKVNADPYLDVCCLKRGDVVEVLRDGQNPGKLDLARADLKIIDCPDMPLSEALALLAGEPGDRRLNRVLRSRAFKLDLDALPEDVRSVISDPERVTQIDALSAADLRPAKVSKPAARDPNILGEPTNPFVL